MRRQDRFDEVENEFSIGYRRLLSIFLPVIVVAVLAPLVFYFISKINRLQYMNYATEVIMEKFDDNIKDIRADLDSFRGDIRQVIDAVISQEVDRVMEERLSSVASIVDRIEEIGELPPKLVDAVSEVQAEIEDLKQRESKIPDLTNLKESLKLFVEDPEKNLSVTLLRKDFETFRTIYDKDVVEMNNKILQSLQSSNKAFNFTLTVIVTAVIALCVAAIAPNISGIMRAKVKREEESEKEEENAEE